MIKVIRREVYCCPFHDLWGNKQKLYDHYKNANCGGHAICQVIEFVDEE